MADNTLDPRVPTPSELSYLSDVLQIDRGETEGQLNEKLRLEAREYGVYLDPGLDMGTPKTKSHSVTTCASSEGPRRSDSITSQTSYSTGLTSIYPNDDETEDRTTAPRPRPSLCFDANETSPAREISIAAAASTCSLPPSPSACRKRFYRFPGLSKLRLNRDSSGGCPHCPLDPHSQRRATHKLPCGHRLCTQALRRLIHTALAEHDGAIPTCCRMPIPDRVLKTVMTQAKQPYLPDEFGQSDEAADLTALPSYPPHASPYQQAPPLPPRPTVPVLQPPLPPRPTSAHSRADSLAPSSPCEPPSSDFHLSQPSYLNLLSQQSAQSQRLTAWTDRTRASLVANHSSNLSSLRSSHLSALEALSARHEAALSEAEDKQVRAEASLRAAQAQTLRDSDVALRHMEAFCRGVYARDGSAHGREVGLRERAELENARRERGLLERRHEAEIAVLRGEQDKRLGNRIERQERAEGELRTAQAGEVEVLENGYRGEMEVWEEESRAKERGMRWRWELERAVVRARIEMGVDGGRVHQ